VVWYIVVLFLILFLLLDFLCLVLEHSLDDLVVDHPNLLVVNLGIRGVGPVGVVVGCDQFVVTEGECLLGWVVGGGGEGLVVLL
jgi:hypothetical protein